MASSSSKTRPPPGETPPPSGVLNRTPGTEPPPWSWQSFLPKDPTAMATGLTPEMFAPSTAAASPPPGGAVGGSASAGLSNAGALASLSPGARQAYEAAMAAGDQVEAARILLAAQISQQGNQRQINTADQSQNRQFGSSHGGDRTSGNQGRGLGGQRGIAGGVGGISSGGIY